ncbi:DUF721 domain-containing protein [Microvirga tunisiensis]|uniref:DUF721 domain-containing protein n=2 Tax=Pannonibacter tanglangensis TaxID=2750084 RepID=A0ABW9ZJ01_9HYPH|nr:MULTISPECIES: DciA family protein [unclassified Pannonibacter]NBN64404.1 DUF721 domain-containing protein [Pannonibacter sp. XCT-34]NBN78937.1 DUF721 domain-containing protein [Pannonibacter sp. XCT-53]
MNWDNRGPSGGASRPLADLIGKAMQPAFRKRGFATADLVASWPDIVGERYGERVRPERLLWPRPVERDGEALPEPATLVVNTDGATALMLTHELPQVIARINAYFGWAAIGRIRIVQKPVTVPVRRRRPEIRPLTGDEQAELDRKLAGVEHEGLRKALEKLGSQVIARNRRA